MQLALRSNWPWQGAAVGGQYCNYCHRQGSIFQLRYCRVNIAAVIGCNYCLAPNPLHCNMDIGPGGIPLGTIIWFILWQCTSSEQQLEHLCCNILTINNELILHDGEIRTWWHDKGNRSLLSPSSEHIYGRNENVDILAPQVPVDTLNGLLGDKEALRKVLLRHVVPGRWDTIFPPILTLRNMKLIILCLSLDSC